MRPSTLVLLATTMLVVACGPSIPLPEQVELTDVTTGWYDAGILPDGKNKLVPTISLHLRNMTADSLRVVQLNAVFRIIDDEEELGTAFTRAIGSDGLMPGDATPPLVLRAQLGYTGEQPRHEMLQHSRFKDALVEVFGKQGSSQWQKLGEFTIERQLLTR